MSTLDGTVADTAGQVNAAEAERARRAQELVTALVQYRMALEEIMQTDEGKKIAGQAIDLISHILGGVIGMAKGMIPGSGVVENVAGKLLGVEAVIQRIAPDLPKDSQGYRFLAEFLRSIKDPAPDVGGKARVMTRIVSKLPVIGPIVDAAGDGAFTVAQLGIDVAELLKITRELKRRYGADLAGPSAQVSEAARAFLPDSADIRDSLDRAKEKARNAGVHAGEAARDAGEAASEVAKRGVRAIQDVHIGDKLAATSDVVGDKAAAAAQKAKETAGEMGDKAKEAAQKAVSGFTAFKDRIKNRPNN